MIYSYDIITLLAHCPAHCREARRQLFQLLLGSELSGLGEEDWERLQARSEGFSGSDIATCVAEAVMQPVRELEAATHWRRVDGGAGLVPCSAGEPEAIHKSVNDLPPHQVSV